MKNFHPTDSCPVRNILDRLGDKWSILIMVTLQSNGTMRFGEIQKTIHDISHRMLSLTLRSLECDGLISRTVYPQVPPRVEYKITHLGESLIPHLDNLIGWAVDNFDSINQNRSRQQV